MRDVALIAGLDLRDGLRRRRQLVIRALTPLALLALLVGIITLIGDDRRLAEDSYRIAVAGDVEGGADTLAFIDQDPKLDAEPTDDPVAAVAGSADAAVVFPPGLDASLAAGGSAELTIYAVTTKTDSRAAQSLLQVKLALYDSPDIDALLADTDTALRAGPVDVTFSDVGGDVGAGGNVAGAVAALVLLQSAVLVGGAAARFTTRRAGGTLAAQLLLPMRRSHLVLGKGLAELGLGLITNAPVLAGLVVGATGALLVVGEPVRAAVALPAIIVVAALVSFAACAAGLVVGARSRSPEQAALGSAVCVVIIAASANAVGLTQPLPDLMSAIPVVGAGAALRAALTDGTTITQAAAGIGSTLLLGWLLTRLAARAFDAERLALRST